MLEKLAPYYAAAQQEAKAREAEVPLRELEWVIRVLPERAEFIGALRASADVAVIAEHKRKSPSKGEICSDNSVAWTVEQYRQGGALALSILTQEAHFGGRLEDIIEARHAVGIPILRKDFIRTPYQLYEAKALGASAALLIVGGLSDTELLDLHKEALDIGLECLVEVHDREELLRALEVGPGLLGINNRNLETLQVDLNTVRGLREEVPGGITTVAASGYNIRKPEDMEELRSLHVDAVLIGRALMSEKEPAQLLRSWLSA